MDPFVILTGNVRKGIILDKDFPYHVKNGQSYLSGSPTPVLFSHCSVIFCLSSPTSSAPLTASLISTTPVHHHQGDSVFFRAAPGVDLL